MFSASYFTYDDVYSGVYGLRIASFKSDSVEETSVFAPSFKAMKSVGGNRFFHNGIDYTNAPEYRFTILCENPISEVVRREILAWLTCTSRYLKLQIHQPDLENCYYMCVFTNIDIIYFLGDCVGFNVTANFDSQYAYGKSQKIKSSCDGAEKLVKLINKSDITDTFTFPIVNFTVKGQVGGKSISIENKSLPMNLPFEFKGLNTGETISVDNELKIINSSVTGDRLSCFNKNWLRLKKGVNELKILAKGDVEIICPTYVLIGF